MAVRREPHHPDRQRVTTTLPISAKHHQEWSRSHSFFSICLVQRGSQSIGQLYRIFVGPKMHEEQAWLFIQHVAVQRSDLDSVRAQRFNPVIEALRANGIQ